MKNLDDHICDRIDSLVGQSVRKHLAEAVSDPVIKANVMKFLNEKLVRSLKQ